MALPRTFSKTERTDMSNDSYRDTWNEIDELEKVILITWTPNDRFYAYNKYGANDYNLQWRTMLNVLCEAPRCCSLFAFMPEISPEGRLHMHGWFIVKDKVKYHKSFLPSLKRGGFIKKKPANSKGWKTFVYHIKDTHDTVEYLTDFDNICLNSDNCSEVKKLIRRDIVLNQPKNGEPKIQTRKINVFAMILGTNALPTEYEYLNELLI